MIKIVACKDDKEVAIKAADILGGVVLEKPDAILGLATGSSPIGMYTELARRNAAGEISFKHVQSVNLDEYVGLGKESDQSYVYFMNENLFSKIDINLEKTNLPNGLAPDAAAECKRYDELIASLGSIDIQVLGIGNNGHIGFNEPDTHFPKTTSLVELTESTIEANSRFFASRELVPTKAISMGIGQIMSAKKILMIAMGKGKSEILEAALFGNVTPNVPASILQFFDGEVYVVADEAALSVIRNRHPEAI